MFLQSGTRSTCEICVLQAGLESPQVRVLPLLHNGKNELAFLGIFGVLLLLVCLFELNFLVSSIQIKTIEYSSAL